MQDSMLIIRQMFGEKVKDYLKILLTKSDRMESKFEVEENKKAWYLELSSNIKIISCGKNDYDELNNDIESININQSYQTEFMQNVQTQFQKMKDLDNQLIQTKNEMEKLKDSHAKLNENLISAKDDQEKLRIMEKQKIIQLQLKEEKTKSQKFVINHMKAEIEILKFKLGEKEKIIEKLIYAEKINEHRKKNKNFLHKCGDIFTNFTGDEFDIIQEEINKIFKESENK